MGFNLDPGESRNPEVLPELNKKLPFTISPSAVIFASCRDSQNTRIRQQFNKILLDTFLLVIIF
jgi:hypothetical protein